MFKQYKIYKYFKKKMLNEVDTKQYKNVDSFIKAYSFNVKFLKDYNNLKEIFNKFNNEIWDIAEEYNILDDDYEQYDEYFLSELIEAVYEIMAEEILRDIWEEGK